MRGLAPGVSKIFDSVSRLECIKPFVLVGGTALSLQIGTRLSEDLDFMRWKTGKNDKLEIGWPNIKKELETIGKVEHVDVLGFDQALFIVDGVKLSFYAAPREKIPTMKEITLLNNLRVADIKSIGAMKMETMSRRSRFRDYYDIYSILKEKINFGEMVDMAVRHSGHALKEKNLLAILANGERFNKEKNFRQLEPVYDVTAIDIQDCILHEIEKKRNKDIVTDIDAQLKKSVSVYKAKSGDMMIRATIGEESYTGKLTIDEIQKIRDHKLSLSEVAVERFHSEAVNNFEKKNNIPLCI